MLREKNMEKFHLILSLILLLPSSVYLEISDGNHEYDSVISLILTQWLIGIDASLSIGSLSWFIYCFIYKKSSFLKACYRSCYFICLLIISAYPIGFLIGIK